MFLITDTRLKYKETAPNYKVKTRFSEIIGKCLSVVDIALNRKHQHENHLFSSVSLSTLQGRYLNNNLHLVSNLSIFFFVKSAHMQLFPQKRLEQWERHDLHWVIITLTFMPSCHNFDISLIHPVVVLRQRKYINKKIK